MAYTAEISRANPTCFLFLIDQSKSMLKLIPGGQGKTKAEAVADSINHLLYSLVLRCVWGQSVLDRFHVGVLGYGVAVGPALGGALAGREMVSISDVARNPLRVEQKVQLNEDGMEQSVRSPVWFEPTGDGKTPMCATLNRAGTSLAGFLADHPDCYPPLVINITDGDATDGDPEQPAARLRQLSSTDGNVLLFNVHISEKDATPVEFPDSEAHLADPLARRLFRMSSTLPAPMWGPARQAGLTVNPQTHGFVYNANLAAVIRSLDIGTRVDFKNLR